MNTSTHPGTILTILSLALNLVGAVPFMRSPLAGQDIPRPGSRVRIQTTEADSAVVGWLVSLTEEGLVYASSDGQEVRVEEAAIERVEVAQVGRRTWTGLGVGALVGAAVLGVAADASYEETDCTSFCFQILDRSDVVVIGVVGGALAGGLLGAIIGSAIRTESWTPLVRTFPADGRGAVVGVGVRLRL